MRSRVHHFIRGVRAHAGLAGLLLLTVAILVFEAPQGPEEADALSVRPDIQAPQHAGTQSARAGARVEPGDKPLNQRSTIRT